MRESPPKMSIRPRAAKKTSKSVLTQTNPGTKQAARKLDQLSRNFDMAVEKLRSNVDAVGESLPQLLATEANRESRRRFIKLAETGVLHDLHTLAVALEQLGPDELPRTLTGVCKYARLAVNQLSRGFDVQPIHQPGDSLEITENQRVAFDWSSDHSGELTFPVGATILRSGWKAGSEVLVKPMAVRVRA